jgi:hypothetical protein
MPATIPALPMVTAKNNKPDKTGKIRIVPENRRGAFCVLALSI